MQVSSVACLNCGQPDAPAIPQIPEARVTYFRCSKCGCVWCISRANPHGPPQRITAPAGNRDTDDRLSIVVRDPHGLEQN